MLKLSFIIMNSCYKTKNSIFDFNEIEEFCNEWGWIHIKDIIQDETCITQGIGTFKGIDGNEYRTHFTHNRSMWIGDVKNDLIVKSKFKQYLKLIAGDYYGKNRENYYFYDVLLIGGGPYDCNWVKEFDKTYEPNQYAIEAHGKPLYSVTLIHMGVSNGKMWEYKI